MVNSCNAGSDTQGQSESSDLSSGLKHGSGNPNVAESQKRTIVPTVCLGIGMLIGGLLGAAIGSLTDRDSLVGLCYIAGAVSGACGGAWFGQRRCRS